MVVSCIHDPVKTKIDGWFKRRIIDWNNLSKLGDLIEMVEPKPKLPAEMPDEMKQRILERMRSEPKPTRKEKKEIWHTMCMESADYYEYLRQEFKLVPYCEEGKPSLAEPGTINCLPRETKSDLIPFIRGIGRSSQSEILEKECILLADTLQNKVASCTDAGKPSPQWLRRRGYTKADLVERGNIKQVK